MRPPLQTERLELGVPEPPPDVGDPLGVAVRLVEPAASLRKVGLRDSQITVLDAVGLALEPPPHPP